MKRFAFVAAAFAAMIVCSSQQASATSPFGYPFVPYGIYQPYGAQYGSTLQTPPYFALNPPVYYGARHARPYGMSPFAAPPMVEAGPGYRGRLTNEFVYPEYEKPAPACPTCSANPCVSHAKIKAAPKLGVVKNNPFVTETKIAKK
ncbi:hypothetical protein [Roseiconus lacunae]|uniref:Uncharacterized protein n=1 Tax=Roseiconus lacunae TaxID=2605694 RepID=A0ABT7PNC7_9BACT|nr:hypothetical protein [Roseiconus lacunae]MCD0461578.1 hypothetical protein [Roseiconus lacunae]MDM4017656.1 hypothetical protein [Roseiconus lacunae]WRQ51082.1 hypothetical protein U8335_00755 [Stieleria sp. HD01]